MHCSCVRQTDLPHTTALARGRVLPSRSDRRASIAIPCAIWSRSGRRPRRSSFRDERRAALVSAPAARRTATSPALERLAQPGTVAVVDGPAGGPVFGPCVHRLQSAARRSAGGVADRQRHARGAGVLAGHRGSRFRGSEPRLGLRRGAPARASSKCAAPAERAAGGRSRAGSRRRCENCARALARHALRRRSGRPGGGNLPRRQHHGRGVRRLLRSLLARSTSCRWTPCCRTSASWPRPRCAPPWRPRRSSPPASGAQPRTGGRRLPRAGARGGADLVRFPAGERQAPGAAAERRASTRRTAAASPRGDLLERARPSFRPTRCCGRWCRIPCCRPWPTSAARRRSAYLAQSEVLYRAILGRMPVAVPRAGFTILDERSDKLMERYGLSLPDFFHGEDAAARAHGREAWCRRRCPRPCARPRTAVEQRPRTPARGLGGLRPDAGAGRSTAARARSATNCPRSQARAGREAMRRDEPRRARRGVALRPDLSRAPPAGAPLLHPAVSGQAWIGPGRTVSTRPSNWTARIIA